MIHHNLSTCTQKGEEKEMTILVLLTRQHSSGRPQRAPSTGARGSCSAFHLGLLIPACLLSPARAAAGGESQMRCGGKGAIMILDEKRRNACFNNNNLIYTGNTR